MYKKISLFVLTVFISFIAVAQNIDSLTVVKAKWHKTKIDKNVVLFQHHFNTNNLFLANENISYLEVKNTGKKAVFAIGAEPKKLLKTSDFGKRDTAIAAINGNFFAIKSGGSVDFVKVNGVIINQTKLLKDAQRDKHQQAAVVIENGILSIKKWDGTTDWETKLPEQDVLLNGPLLTFNNVDEILESASFTQLRHPRTCLGIKPNGSVIMLTVDGRNKNSAGMNLNELSALMKWLGCTSSLNFDGGGSTTMWVNGFGENGIVNYPTDNRKWDHEGERRVANAILIKKK